MREESAARRFSAVNQGQTAAPHRAFLWKTFLSPRRA
jgi:hypothetical protein